MADLNLDPCNKNELKNTQSYSYTPESTNMADQLRLSPEGKASSDSSTDSSNIVGNNKQRGDFLNPDYSFLPVNDTSVVLDGSNPGIRVVVGATSDELEEQDKDSGGDSIKDTANATVFHNESTTWTSKTTTTTVHPLEASVVATTTGHLFSLNKMAAGFQPTATQQQHLSPKGHYSGGPGSRKVSPGRRRYNGPLPPRSRGNSPCSSNGKGGPANQVHNQPQQQQRSNHIGQQQQQQANGQHVVLLHVNPGETISFQIGEQVQLFQGPATVRMVSSNSTPPVPMPVQVPPGHMVQQIVDENGTLRHIILSPQPTTITMPPPPPPPMSHNQMHGHHLPGTVPGPAGPVPSTYSPGSSNGASGSGSGPTFFGYPPPPPPSFVSPQFPSQHLAPTALGGGSGQVPPIIPGSIVTHPSGNSPSHSGSSTYNSNPGQYHHVHHHHHHHHAVNNNNSSSSNCNNNNHNKMADGPGGGMFLREPPAGGSNVPRDERAQKQVSRLKKKLEARNQKEGLLIFQPHLNPVGLLAAHNSTKVFLPSPNHSPKKGSNATLKTSSYSSSNIKTTEDNKANDEERVKIEKVLSRIEAPTLVDVGSRECRVQWKPPNLETQVESDDKSALNENKDNLNNNNLESSKIQESDLTYEVFVTDRKIANVDFKDSCARLAYNGALLESKVEDLKPGTDYYFVIRAIADDVYGSVSQSTMCKTKNSEPEQPLPPKLASKARTSLTLKWSPPFDNKSRITNYILESDEGQDEFVECFSGLQKQFKVTKLNPSTCYRFRLAACNSVGKSEYSDVACFSTSGSAPTQPNPPFTNKVGVNEVHLEWQKRPLMDEDFTLQMEDDTTKHGFLPVYNGRDSIHVCTGLKRNLDYKFRLCANNEEGSSPWSKIVSYTTLPDAPTCPGKPALKGKIHSHQFRIEWDKPRDDGGSQITCYVAEIDKGCGFEILYRGIQTECNCDNLAPGTTYCMRVACFTDGGQSPFSETTCITTQPICPSVCAVPRLQGKPKALLLHLKWSSPDFDGGSPVTEYEVCLSTPDGLTTRQAYLGPETDCMVAGLLPGRLYHFAVRASNRIGAGPWSEQLEVLSGAGPPCYPTSFQAVSRSPQSIFLSWTEPENNGASVTEYRVEWLQRLLEGEQSYTALYSGANTNYEVKNLTPATVYSFQAQAVNSAGMGPFCQSVDCATLSSSPASVSSSSIVLQSCNPTSLSLTWSEPLCHGSPILSYNVEVTCIGTEPILTSTLTNEVNIEQLTPETTYKVRVQAVNSIGPGSFSSAVKATTMGLPPAPPTLECLSANHNSLRLKWGDGKNPDFFQYSLEMENKAGNFTCVYQGTSQSYKISKLRETNSYCFRIRASSDSGDGPHSKDYVFQTTRALPPVCKTPKIVWTTPNTCHIEWTGVKLTSDDPVSYVLQMQKSKESNYVMCYEGKDVRFVATHLQPKTCGSCLVRVAAVRHCIDGELLQGAWCSPIPLGYPEGFVDQISSTNQSNKAGVGGAYTQGGGIGSGLASAASIMERKPLTDQQWAIIILCAFTLFAVCVAMVIEKLIS